MVVYQNIPPAPFPASAEPSANSKPAPVSDFAYHAPDAPESFSKRFDTALQSRQSALTPPARPPAPEAKPAESPDNADTAKAQEDSADPDANADSNGHKPKANDRQKLEARIADTASPAALLTAAPNPAPQAAVITIAPLVAQTAIQNVAPPAASPTAGDSKNTPPLQAVASAANVVSPKQNTSTLTQTAPQTAAAQTASIPATAQAAVPVPYPSGDKTALLNSAANTPLSAVIPQNSATTDAVVTPKPPADSVDSRLVRSLTTPGTDKPAPAATQNLAGALSPASAETSKAPGNAVPQSAAPPVLSASGTPASAVDTVTVLTLPGSIPVKPVTAAGNAVPVSNRLFALVTAASTSNQLARLRTIGDAESIPAKQADVPVSPAPIAKPAGSVPAVPGDAGAAASIPTAPASAKPADTLPAKPQETAVAASASVTQTAAVTAKPGPLPAAALNTTGANILPPAAVSSPQTETDAAFTSPFDAPPSAPIAAVTADTAPALIKAAAPGLPHTGANPAAGAAEIIGSEAVVRQAGAGNANTDSHGEDRPADSRKNTDIPAAKIGAARPELLIGVNGTAAAKADSVSPASTDAPIDRTKLLDQVTQHLETLRLADGRGEVSFRLAPDHLGSLQITLSAHAGGVTARVIAEHAGVRQALESAAGHLRDALENRGLKLHSLNVTTAQNGLLDGRSAGNAPNPQQRETLQDRTSFGRASSRSGKINTVPAAPALTPIADVTRGANSRLDYLA